MTVSPELAALLDEQPKDSPQAVTAWMARKLADRLIVAVRTMDRQSADYEVQDVADDLIKLANIEEFGE
ncbi:hypothetical protein CcrMagneto_gp285 [Caulobacter virus Magneto]|uniref:Uncharacterized protein n=5 Tax=Viruses TaxID=10239 RepID=J3UI46_9CAUD|nr:hypothetical protein D865_gp142 [Caulobacter phage phiCbK]YP_006988967.1 hypothetical protein CcrMagneto_gp285 [Caulobacter virus Magneto]ARB15189.1 hypothetical protein Ccr32_gp271 [Caulobacter phage Ccr32]ARB15523.1 hypothetical protein Ccr34_gp281 [Caulobacter phage Ccr34]AFO71559.1 hypothetical protein phiCbK_045 [Caulobacter phage phiCbK]AFU87108.1 hypothetical protein CbK_gp276 [Caulobacter phage phiCbK]AFU87455.1 hypothetical protein CcrMagneto_gp285 [Caulobacter virus Magneto]